MEKWKLQFICKKWMKSKFEEGRDTISQIITTTKNDYNHQLALKISDSKASSKTKWPILKIFYDGKKVPLIPLPLVNNTLISEF